MPDDTAMSPPTSELCVVLSADLHARPAGQVTRRAAQFESTVRIAHAGRGADAASVLAVMGLGATAGSAVQVHAYGPDAEEAARAIARVLEEAV